MHNKNILIIDTACENLDSLNTFFDELGNSDISLSLITFKGGVFAGHFKEKGRSSYSTCFGKQFPGTSGFLWQMLVLPLLIATSALLLIKLKKIKPIDQIVCIGLKEKLAFTPPALLLGIRVGWFELPESSEKKNRGFCGIFLKMLAGKSDVYVFTENSKARLTELGLKPKKFIKLAPAVKPIKHQDSIFENLAHNDQNAFRKKFFTLGTILDLSRAQKLEYLFQSVKTCLTVIPNIQLVVVGDGKARKELLWLAKKMQIGNIVWFVGEQKSIKKWLVGFDIYVSTADNPGLNDLCITLEALSNSLPTVCPSGSGFEDLIDNGKTGILSDMDNVEILSRQIIKLYKEPALRNMLGKNAKEFVDKFFALDRIREKYISSLQENNVSS
jgi:glycosyltransferase involved in cell wall biosynthesis